MECGRPSAAFPRARAQQQPTSDSSTRAWENGKVVESLPLIMEEPARPGE
jgi:hypothetical protein